MNCVKEATTARPKRVKQPKTTNGSLTQRDHPAPGGGLHLEPTCTQKVY